MAIVNSVKNVAPSIGAGNFYASTLGTAPAAGATTIRVPAGTAILTPAASNGRLRVKVTPGTGGTGLVGAITGTAGTTLVSLYPGDGAASVANVIVDRQTEFISDIPLQFVSVPVTITGTGAVVDVEMIYSV